MDIISYGIASQAAKEEKKVREETLAIGVEGTFPHVKARIDALDESLDNVVAYTNKLALNNAVNITKANAKLNIIAQTAKYNMHNMIFDDFLDLTGIDTANSSGYTFDATNGIIESDRNGDYVIETSVENIGSIPKKAILHVEEFAYTDNLIPNMTGYNSPSGSVQDSGNILTWNGTTYFGWRAFAGIEAGNSEFWSTSSPTGWISYQFEEPKIIKKYRMWCRNSQQTTMPNAERSPRSWRFEAWNGSQWVVLDTRTNHTEPTWGVWKDFEFDNNRAYSRYRLVVTQNNGGTHVEIVHLQMMEQKSNHTGEYYISRDGGNSWEPIKPETIFYFDDNVSGLDDKMKIKMKMPAGTKLLNYGLTWV